MVIGYDRRFQSDAFAAGAAEVLAGNGYRVLLTDRPTPTPIISFGIADTGSLGGINITASHNPPADNGFKVRDQTGGAVPPEQLGRIEACIPAMDSRAHIQSRDLDKALADGSVRYFDPGTAYSARIAELVDLDPLRAADLTVQVDAMWGNGRRLAAAASSTGAASRCPKSTANTIPCSPTCSGRNRFRPTWTPAWRRPGSPGPTAR